MMSETQVHTIARQMLEQHGAAAIAQAAQKAQGCESRGDDEDSKEWRHTEDAMKATCAVRIKADRNAAPGVAEAAKLTQSADQAGAQPAV